MHYEPQPSPRSELDLYDAKVIVAGTRGYDDYFSFSGTMFSYVDVKLKGKRVIFISGKASSGADDMIIRWCKENGFPWVEFPADWEQFGKRAGYIRNSEMSLVATHLLIFWDGVSKGTRHMLEAANKRRLAVTTIMIDITKKANDYGWQPQSSRRRDLVVYRGAVA